MNFLDKVQNEDFVRSLSFRLARDPGRVAIPLRAKARHSHHFHDGRASSQEFCPDRALLQTANLSARLSPNLRRNCIQKTFWPRGGPGEAKPNRGCAR